METAFITTKDGKHIAYDVLGTGPALLLLHGGGPGISRQDWHKIGYVERLKEAFTVITMDIRGHGESDKPVDPADYNIDTMCRDILDVASACDVNTFVLWGYSFGGNIGRFLAARSDRVTKLIIMGIPLGLAVPAGLFRDFVAEFQSHWGPIVQAYLAGTLDVTTLSEEERQELEEIKYSRFAGLADRDAGLGEPLNQLIYPAQPCGWRAQKMKAQSPVLRPTKQH